jgi:hypothetical protein
MIQERERSAASGLLMLLVLLAVLGLAGWRAFDALSHLDVVAGLAWLFVDLVAAALLAGFFMVNPNEGRVLQLFGDYRGTVKEPGLRWANPFFSKKAISLRVRNFETGRLKVNDTDGNPVEIAAVVVWRVVDTAEASFEVDDYEHYVHVQSGRPCATWPRATPTTHTTTRTSRCAETPRRSPATSNRRSRTGWPRPGSR